MPETKVYPNSRNNNHSSINHENESFHEITEGRRTLGLNGFNRMYFWDSMN